MKHWRKGLKRITAVALAVMMIGTTVDVSALAVLAAEEVAEVTCNHVCDEACGGMQAATEGALTTCTHVHDEECGYEEAEAECTCETDDPAFHATNCPAYIAPENPQCTCAEKCTDDTLNVWCDVCGVQGVNACQGEDTAVAYEMVANGTCGAEGNENSVTWSLDSDGTLTISGSGAMWDYYTGDKRAPWNVHKDNITTVIIEEGVTTIGTYAFWMCKQLTEITISATVTTIGDRAFFLCERLIQITIPQSVTSIGEGVFAGCSSLTSVTLPNSISTIQEDTFLNCKSLTSLTIPNGVTTIGAGAFYNCTSLNSITIPEGVTTIGDLAFSGCTSLETIVIPSSVTTIGANVFNEVPGVSSEDGFLIINGILMKYTGDAANVEIPSGVTKINQRAFEDNQSIVTVKIPSGVTTLGSNAFFNCDSLVSVELPETLISMESSFIYCDGLKEITIPNGMETIGRSAFYECINLEKVTIPNSVTEIGKEAFKNIAADATINAPCSWNENPLYSFADGITVNISAHQNLTYSVNDEGNVINNECSNCGKVGGTLTINAEGGIYDGTTKYGATVEKTGTLENKEVTVNYYKGGTLIGTNAPINADTYTAKITYKEVTVYDEFEIAKGTPDIGTVSASNMVNTLDVSEVVLSRSNETVHGTLSLADGTTLQYGIHDYTYVFTPNDNTNYETVTGTVSITITDINAPTATYKVGTDEWKQFINTITFGHFCKDYTTIDITYSDEESGVADKQYYISDVEITNTENIQWSEYTDTLNINATGKYYIYVRVTDNYGNVVIQNSEGIVVYAESVITPTSFSCEYGEENALDVNISTNGNTFANLTDGSGNEIATENYSIDASTLTIKGEYLSDLDVGEYTYKICMNPQGVENTEVTLAYSFVVNVTAKKLSVTGATAASRDYIANDKTIDITGVTLSGKQGTDDVSVEITGLKGTLSSANAGTYTSVTLPTLTLTGDDAENYEIVQPTSAVATNVTINKATPVSPETPEATAITYGDTLSSSVLDDSSWTWLDGTIVPDASTDCIAYIEVDDSNYNYTGVEGYDSANHRVVRSISVIVNKATLTVAAKSYTIKVGEALPTYEYTVTGLVGNDTLPVDVTVSCSATDSNTVGTYPITISGVASDALASLYAPIYVNGTLTITEKEEQKITASDVTLTYGETKNIGATTNGNGAITYSTTSDVISVAADGTITALKAGPATVTITTAETADYAEATKTISVTVNKKKVAVPAVDTNGYIYTGTAQTYGVTSTDDYTVEGGVQTNAGEYPVTITLNNENYEWDGTLGTYIFIINKAAVTVTAKSYTIKVGDTLPTYAYDVTGLVNSETLPIDVAISCTATNSNTAGTYAITVSGAANSANYLFTYVNGTLTVSNKEEQTITASDVTLTYGETGKKISATTNGGGAITYTVATGTDVISVAADGTITVLKAGTATVTICAVETDDYAAAAKTISVTVNKAENAPNMPGATMNVSYDTETVGAVTLPEGWKWKEGDSTKALTEGGTVTVTAVYCGADAGNYNTEAVEVAIKRGTVTPTVTPTPTKKPSSGGFGGGGNYIHYVGSTTPVPTVAPAPTAAPTPVPTTTPVPGTVNVPTSGKTVVDGNGNAVTSVVQEPGTTTKLAVKQEEGKEVPVTWESSNPAIAEVDKDGNVTMKMPGLAEVVATVGEGKDAKTETIVILVEEPRTYVNPLEEAFKDVRLGTSREDIPLIRHLKLGENVDINFYGVKNWKQGNYEYIWETSDKTVATVDGKGRVTALKPGVVDVTLGLKNKAGGHSLNVQSIKLVVPGDYENKILLGTSKNNTFDSIVLNLNERIDINFYGVKHWKKEEYEYYWSSSEPSVVWVDNLGRLVPVNSGKAEIFLVLIEKKNGAPRYVVPMEVTVPEK